MKAMTWLPKLAVLPLLAAIATGCPLGQSGVNNTSSTLTLAVLAVTATDADLGRVIPKVYLKWNEVPGAAKYELNTIGSNKPLQSSSETSYIDATGIEKNASMSYFVRALDATNGPKTTSETITVTVQDQQVGSPGELQISSSVGGKVTQAKPTFAWGQVPKATAYFVKVSNRDSNTVIYAALTDQTSVQLGQLPFKTVDWPASSFKQKGEDAKLELGKLYKFELFALRGDSDSLGKVLAVDVSTSDMQLREFSN